MKILSLTYSAIDREKKWNTFNQVHTKRRNKLKQRIKCFLYIKYNLQFEIRQKSREEKRKTYDLICLLNIDSDNEMDN